GISGRKIPGAIWSRCGGLFCFQWDGGECAELAGADAAVSCGAVSRAVSYLYGRMWRAGKVYGLQTRASGRAGREVDGGNGGACLSRNWRPASCAAAGDFDYASDRDGHGVQAGGNRGTGAVCPRAGNVLARGRGANCKRRGGAATNATPGDARLGSGRAFAWRDEERFDGRGGGGVFSSGTGGRFLAAKCGAREPDGAPAGTGSEENSASQGCVSRGGEWSVCANSAGGD